MTLWAGRVEVRLAPEVWEFLRAHDAELLPYDCKASRVHARRLHAAGVLSDGEYAEADRLLGTLDVSALADSDEDVHSAIERALGEVGRKIHAGRSRNDQVAAAMRLYVEDACAEALESVGVFARTVLDLAEAEAETLMPGYTHLQRAQPVTLGWHLLAWAEMLDRDRARFRFAAERAAESPLGREAEPRAVAVEHLRPGEQVPAERDRLRALEVRVAGHERVGLRLGDVEHGQREGADRVQRLGAGVLDVEPHRGRDLVVARAARVDLPAHFAELPLDRRVDVLVFLGDRWQVERRQHLVYLRELIVVEQPGRVQPPRMETRPLAVVGEQLRVVRAEEVPDLGRELNLDPPRPERHPTATFLARAAASSASSEASRMNPSAASCGKVSPVAYEASVSA
jgi:hypothetical protein